MKNGKILLAGVILTLGLIGCRSETEQASEPVNTFNNEIQSTGEELLIAAMDEVAAISEGSTSGLAKTGADSVYIYGQVTPDGFGAVVTERHAYPKGILLISVRKSFGRNGRVVSEVRRYVSDENQRQNLPDQTVITEIIPLSQDTIVTHVVRDGILETYTFRLPVVTRISSQVDQTTRVTSRFALNGSIVVETTDGIGGLIKRSISRPLPSGALQTRTEYPNGTWKEVTVLGLADASILRETTTGQ